MKGEACKEFEQDREAICILQCLPTLHLKLLNLKPSFPLQLFSRRMKKSIPSSRDLAFASVVIQLADRAIEEAAHLGEQFCCSKRFVDELVHAGLEAFDRFF